MNTRIQNLEVRAVENAAADVRDLASDLLYRTASTSDRGALESMKRDLERMRVRLVEIRDRRKRKPSSAGYMNAIFDAAEAHERAQEPAPAELPVPTNLAEPAA